MSIENAENNPISGFQSESTAAALQWVWGRWFDRVFSKRCDANIMFDCALRSVKASHNTREVIHGSFG